MRLRRPSAWLESIATPVFVFEGQKGPISNIGALRRLQRASTSPEIHFCPVPGGDHFTVLAPTNALIASKIRLDTGNAPNIAFTPDELGRLIPR